jgi:hypothetical protein
MMNNVFYELAGRDETQSRSLHIEFVYYIMYRRESNLLPQI